MKAHAVTSSITLLAAAGNRDFLHIYNISDTVVYVSYDGDPTPLTTANGFPIPPNGSLFLNADGHKQMFHHAVYVIHGTTGSKELRIQGES